MGFNRTTYGATSEMLPQCSSTEPIRPAALVIGAANRNQETLRLTTSVRLCLVVNALINAKPVTNRCVQ